MGFTFSKLIRGDHTWLQDKYNLWLDKSRNSVDSDREAARIISHILTKNEERIRTESWSASSAGRCLREQQFVYLGFPQGESKYKQLNIFANGDYVHLRHQVAGLSEGYYTDVEVPVLIPEFKVKGTMDAICEDGSIVDIKSMNTYVFKKQFEEGKPKEEHVRQVHAYMRATGIRKARLLYEDKNTQEVQEFVVDWEDEVNEKNEDDWRDLSILTQREELAPAYPEGDERCEWCVFNTKCREWKFNSMEEE